MIYLTESDVRRFLPMKDCVQLMRSAFQHLASGEALNQPRRRLILPTRSTLHYMAGSDGRYFGTKIYYTNPRSGARFLFLLYRAADAALLAILEANHLGQIRTGAVSGLATSLLARPDSRTVALIGTGFQAQTQLEATLAVMKPEQIRVWSRSSEKRATFSTECGERFGVRIDAGRSAEDAVRGADIVITATSASEPVVESSWVSAGAHINAVGSNRAQHRELPADLIHRSGLIVVDSREQSRMESGDLLMALDDAGWDRTVELADVAAGRSKRNDPSEITLFKSNGLAVEDVAAAGLVYERAVAAGVGRPIYS